jgi:phosphatidate cytidylyltransferase
MLQRTFSTIILWAAVLGCVGWLGAPGGVWLVAVVSVLTQWEFCAMLRKMGLEPFARLGLFFGALITLAPWAVANGWLPAVVTPELLLALAVVAFAVRILGEREPHNRVETLAWTLFGLVYVPFMLQFLVRVILLRAPHEGSGLLLAVWLIAVSKGCDMGALLTGKAFGRRKMSPHISPKKTWEGAVGGVLFSALLGAAIAHGLPGSAYVARFPAAFTPGLAALVAVPIALLTIVSDLIESVIKRRADTKDSGATIPGIGGVFDLSDSLILVAPAGWLVLSLLS